MRCRQGERGAAHRVGKVPTAFTAGARTKGWAKRPTRLAPIDQRVEKRGRGRPGSFKRKADCGVSGARQRDAATGGEAAQSAVAEAAVVSCRGARRRDPLSEFTIRLGSGLRTRATRASLAARDEHRHWTMRAGRVGPNGEALRYLHMRLGLGFRIGDRELHNASSDPINESTVQKCKYVPR